MARLTFQACNMNFYFEEHPAVWFPSDYAVRFCELLMPYIRPGVRVLDVATGSGVLAIFCSKLGAQSTALDLNPLAIMQTRRNAELNDVQVEAIASDCFQSIRTLDRMRYFDILVCNSPTLPGKVGTDRTTANEWNQNGSGRDVLDAVLAEGFQYLRPDGLLLSCSSSEQHWHTTSTLLVTNWANSKVVSSMSSILSDPIYLPYIETWLTDGRAVVGAVGPCHEIKFFIAHPKKSSSLVSDIS